MAEHQTNGRTIGRIGWVVAGGKSTEAKVLDAALSFLLAAGRLEAPQRAGGYIPLCFLPLPLQVFGLFTLRLLDYCQRLTDRVLRLRVYGGIVSVERKNAYILTFVGVKFAPRSLTQRRIVQFSQCLDVPQHPQMNSMNDEICPKLPIARWPHVVSIPGGSFQARPPIRKGYKQELSPL